MKTAGPILLLVALSVGLPAGLPAEILDRTVAAVGSRPITATEVERQLRLEALFNDAALDLSDPARAAALDRLVEQRLIETDMAVAGFPVAEDRELDAAFEQLSKGRFGGLSFGEALARYRLQERDAQEFLRRQLRFSHYVQFRFRAGLQTDEAAIRAAYRRQYGEAAAAPPLDEVREELRRQLLDKLAETMLDERVRQLRAETRILFLDPIGPAPEGAP